jgi:hypothetical protein
LRIGQRWAIDQASDAFDDVVDVGEVALMLALV